MKQPTILYICTDTDHLAGSSRSLLAMIKALGERIHPIVLFPEECPVEEIYRREGVETIVHQFTLLMEKPRYRLVRILKNPIGCDFYRDLKIDVGCCRFVRKRLSGRGVKLVHTNVSVTAVGAMIAWSMHVPHVWHIREICGMFPGCLSLRLWRWLVNTAAARIFISNAVAESWMAGQRRSFVIYNAVVPNGLPPAVLEKSKTVLHCSAALENRKGVKTAVKAFVQSCLFEQGYRLQLIGSCTEDYRRELLETVKDTPQAVAAVEFVDYTYNVADYFRHASVFLMCSPNEPLGRVTIEAMYYGCPVIGRAAGGTKEIIDDRRTGYLFASDDELPQLLIEVLSTDQSKLIKRAQHEAVAKFSGNSFLPSLIKVYNGLLNGSSLIE